MPNINEVIQQRRLRLVGHCIMHTDEQLHFIWRQCKKFIKILKNDCNYDEEDELRSLMMYREGWKVIERSGLVRPQLK